jgi:hypothetical protein
MVDPPAGFAMVEAPEGMAHAWLPPDLGDAKQHAALAVCRFPLAGS